MKASNMIKGFQMNEKQNRQFFLELIEWELQYFLDDNLGIKKDEQQITQLNDDEYVFLNCAN